MAMVTIEESSTTIRVETAIRARASHRRGSTAGTCGWAAGPAESASGAGLLFSGMAILAKVVLKRI
jgi:hypothetical protein